MWPTARGWQRTISSRPRWHRPPRPPRPARRRAPPTAASGAISPPVATRASRLITRLATRVGIQLTFKVFTAEHGGASRPAIAGKPSTQSHPARGDMPEAQVRTRWWHGHDAGRGARPAPAGRALTALAGAPQLRARGPGDRAPAGIRRAEEPGHAGRGGG